MQQEQVSTDEEAFQFLREWVLEPGRFADTHLQSEAFRKALYDYDFARQGLKKDVQGALQHALNVAGGGQS